MMRYGPTVLYLHCALATKGVHDGQELLSSQIHGHAANGRCLMEWVTMC